MHSRGKGSNPPPPPPPYDESHAKKSTAAARSEPGRARIAGRRVAMSMRGATPVVPVRAKGAALSKFRSAAKRIASAKRIIRHPSVRRMSAITTLRQQNQTAIFEGGGARELMRARDDEMVHAWSMSARKREFDLEETVAMMTTLGFHIAREDSEKIFSRMDTNKSETLNASEVLTFLDAYEREGWTHHHDPYGGMAYHYKAGRDAVKGRAGEVEQYVWGGAGLGGDDSKFKNEYAARLRYQSTASLVDLKRDGSMTEALLVETHGVAPEAQGASIRNVPIDTRVAARSVEEDARVSGVTDGAQTSGAPRLLPGTTPSRLQQSEGAGRSHGYQQEPEPASEMPKFEEHRIADDGFYYAKDVRRLLRCTTPALRVPKRKCSPRSPLPPPPPCTRYCASSTSFRTTAALRSGMPRPRSSRILQPAMFRRPRLTRRSTQCTPAAVAVVGREASLRMERQSAPGAAAKFR